MTGSGSSGSTTWPLSATILENERMALDECARRMPVGVRKYYFDRISELDDQIKDSKQRYPSFVGVYDTNNIHSLKNVPFI